MYSLLKKVHLKELCAQPVMFDACVFMIGIENRTSDPNCSFEKIKDEYLIPLFENFKQIYIHEMVYDELDDSTKHFVDSYRDKNVKVVSEDDRYGKDPKYTTIFNKIANHELVNYVRMQRKNRGEVFSLAYAAYNGINFFGSRDNMVDIVADELEDLNDVEIVTFDIVVLVAYIHFATLGLLSQHKKALKAGYKIYCESVIKRHKLPSTLSKYAEASKDWI